MDDTFVPMDFRQKDGQLVGYDVDLAKAVCKKLGLKADFQTIDWSMKETELRNGTIDVLWNGYSVTSQRKKKVAFSRSYLRNRQVLVVKKSSGIKSFAQMKGQAIGPQSGSTAQIWLDGSQKVIKPKSKVLYDITTLFRQPSWTSTPAESRGSSWMKTTRNTTSSTRQTQSLTRSS